MENKRRIVWDEPALIHVENALTYISKDSVQQAEQVEQAILNFLDKAALNPERFPPDKFKHNNTGRFRAFETHSYRISFSFDDKELHVLRVKHVRQKPVKY